MARQSSAARKCRRPLLAYMTVGKAMVEMPTVAPAGWQNNSGL